MLCVSIFGQKSTMNLWSVWNKTESSSRFKEELNNLVRDTQHQGDKDFYQMVLD